MKPLLTLVLILLGGATLLFVGCQATRLVYESAPYQTVRPDREFSLRDYPALAVVETAMLKAG